MKPSRSLSWLVALAVLGVGCAPDRTLDSLVPRQALAVALVDQPGWVASTLVPPDAGLPWKALDGGQPWAAVVMPGAPPGFRLFLALGNRPDAWDQVVQWAQTKGGLQAERQGRYAVLSTPGMGPVSIVDPTQRFDLSRVRRGGHALVVYWNVPQAWADPHLPPGLRSLLGVIPGLPDQLAGLRMGVDAGSGGLEVTLATDWNPNSTWRAVFQTWSVPGVVGWEPHRPAHGVAAAVGLPPAAWNDLAGLWDRSLAARWLALVPVLGPRASVVVEPRPKGLAWSVGVETKDPQAVRQALKTLVASGDLQRQFQAWSLDPDVPVIYRDRMADGQRETTLTVGDQKFVVRYGVDRVTVEPESAGLTPWRPTEHPLVAPGRRLATVAGTWDDLGAEATASLERDGNLTVRIRVDAREWQVWKERLPQVLRQGTAGLTLWEP